MLTGLPGANEDLQALDAAHHLHPFTDHKALNAEGSRIIVKGQGVWIWDSHGHKILDGMAGLWCVQVGYGRAEIADAVAAQLRQLAFYNTFFKTTHEGAARLATELARLAPEGLNRVFFTNSGSEANDTVYRMLHQYWALQGKPERNIIIGRRYGYHGSTVAASALGGMSAMHAQGGTMGNIHHIDPPYWYGEAGGSDPQAFGLERARQLEAAIEKLGADKVSAFIAEPIQGAGGVIIPPDSYWPEIQRICSRHGVLLVVDEVICGFGRTGHWFASDHYGIRPDLMPFAKGLTSGYIPMGGVMVSDKVADVLIDKGGEFYHGFTYAAHPAACAAALANLRILEDEGIIAKVREDTGPYLQQCWHSLADHPLVGETRMVGMIGALELSKDKRTRAFFPRTGTAGTLCRDISFANDLVMRAVRDSMIIAPPLIISHAEIDELVTRARRTLDQTHERLKADGWFD